MTLLDHLKVTPVTQEYDQEGSLCMLPRGCERCTCTGSGLESNRFGGKKKEEHVIFQLRG